MAPAELSALFSKTHGFLTWEYVVGSKVLVRCKTRHEVQGVAADIKNTLYQPIDNTKEQKKVKSERQE